MHTRTYIYAHVYIYVFTLNVRIRKYVRLFVHTPPPPPRLRGLAQRSSTHPSPLFVSCYSRACAPFKQINTNQYM